tara:strand:- start:3279 stop:3473 length:195 start_codon:yes stop_codon:yes gene_type:complete
MRVIRRSMESLPAGTTIAGDLTVAGDVIVTAASKGFVSEDQSGDDKRITPFDDNGTPTIKVEDV